MKKAIIIGGTTGIGRELAVLLAQKKYEVIATGRSVGENADQENIIRFEYMDVTDVENAVKKLKDIIIGADLVIISAGTGFINPDLDLEKELATIAVNVTGFTAMADEAYKYFSDHKKGHLVGISSIAALLGDDSAPAYNASKAYVSNYLSGLHKKSVKQKNGVKVTTVLPGFVDTKMAQDEGLFWVAPVNKAAKQILSAIEKRKSEVIITKRWRIVTFLLKIMPDFIYNRL